jgi:dihydrofolate reductase
MTKINIIVAICKNNGIGLNNKLPWYYSSDLKKFKTLTTGNKKNAVIMGKNTYQSINKNLLHRDNLILSKSLIINEKTDDYILKSFNNLDSLLNFTKTKNYENIWVIGGSQIYKLFLNKNIVDNIYLTYINQSYECDIFFPKINLKNFKLIKNSIQYNDNEFLKDLDLYYNNYQIYDKLYVKI